MNAMRREKNDQLAQWKLLELEPVENIQRVITRLAPPRPQGLAAKLRDYDFEKHIQAPGLPVRTGQAEAKAAVDAYDGAVAQNIKNDCTGNNSPSHPVLGDCPYVDDIIINQNT